MTSTIRIPELKIPITEWGRDHWQLLIDLYHNDNERNAVLKRRYMRTGKHNGILAGDGGRITDYGTRTKVGIICDHDDWDCINDFIVYGLCEYATTRSAQQLLDPVIPLSSRGHSLAEALIKHNDEGGHSRTFIADRIDAAQGLMPDPLIDPIGFSLQWASLDWMQRAGYVWPKNLDWANLAGMDLRGCDLSGRSLYGTNFQGANTTGVNFTDSDLTGADFTDAVTD
jgi:hypothetical protein